MRLFLILLVVPIIEIALFIEVGGRIGTWPTVAIVVLTAVVGTVMLRRQGLAALRGLQHRLAAGENPGRVLADGAMILVAGVLLITPGFLTDAVGLALLVPAVRGWLWDRLEPRLTIVHVAARGSDARSGRAQRAWPGGQTVEGEYEEIELESSGGPNDHDGRAPRNRR
jgi:UPF0716 protein FxsA